MALTIREAIIPASNANRPGIKLMGGKPMYITVHETSNQNVGANAEMHRRFLAAGGGPEGVSFHWCVDDREAVHLLPDDEVGWHAGDGGNGTGNRQSVAIETCVNQDGNWARCRANLAELVAMLMHKHGVPLSNVVQHNRWSGKNCPLQIRRDGLWAGTIAAIKVAYEAGGTPTPVAGEGVRQYLNERGELIAEVNFGGQATEILGVNYADLGGSVKNAAGEEYDRSLIAGAFGPWVKR